MVCNCVVPACTCFLYITLIPRSQWMPFVLLAPRLPTNGTRASHKLAAVMVLSTVSKGLLPRSGSPVFCVARSPTGRPITARTVLCGPELCGSLIPYASRPAKPLRCAIQLALQLTIPSKEPLRMPTPAKLQRWPLTQPNVSLRTSPSQRHTQLNSTSTQLPRPAIPCSKIARHTAPSEHRHGIGECCATKYVVRRDRAFSAGIPPFSVLSVWEWGTLLNSPRNPRLFCTVRLCTRWHAAPHLSSGAQRLIAMRLWA